MSNLKINSSVYSFLDARFSIFDMKAKTSIEHPASSIQHPASSIEYPASRIEHQPFFP